MIKNSFLLFIIFISNSLLANSFLKTEGRIIVNENNEKVVLKGFGLGGWLVLEGYIWNCNINHASTRNIENEIEALIGSEKKGQFFDLYRKNYINEKEVEFLAEQGFNAIRVPLHYKHFSPSFGTFINDGFDLLDPLIDFCRENNIYLILDMHAAPGAQNTNDFSDSDGIEAKLFTDYSNQIWFASTWRYIAEYYANEPVIGGYDLLNEPARWGIANTLRSIYGQTIDSIRTVDPNHIVIIEGNWFGNDHTGLLPPFDDEMVYSFHHYIGSSADSITSSDPSHWMHQYITDISLNYDVPLWIGEFGENSNHWAYNKTKFFERHNIGWSWWNFKSIERISSLFSYEISEEYQVLIDYWNGNGSKPDTISAFNGLLSMAENLSFDSCKINKGLVRGLIDPNFDSLIREVTSKAFPELIINYSIQDNPRGISHAFSKAEQYIDTGDTVIFVLGDNFFEENLIKQVDFNNFSSEGGCIIFTTKVKNPNEFGVASIDELGNVMHIEEKPAEPKSNLAVVGLYIFDSDAVDNIRKISPSSRGEYEITDLINIYINEKKCTNVEFEGWWIDAGTPDRIIELENLLA